MDIPSRRVETYCRAPQNDWLFHEYLPGGGDCVFPTLEISIPFDEIFESVFPEEPPDGAEHRPG